MMEPFQSLKDDDWIKFGYTLWSKHKHKWKMHALKQYKKVWQNIYHSKADLEGGGPINRLGNPKYFCRGYILWSPHYEA